MAYEVLATSVS